MQTTFNEYLPWSHRLETGPAKCAERLNNNNNNNNNYYYYHYYYYYYSTAPRIPPDLSQVDATMEDVR